MDRDDAIYKIAAFTTKHEETINMELQRYLLAWLDVEVPVQSAEDMIRCNGYMEAKLSQYYEEWLSEVWEALGHEHRLIHLHDTIAEWWAKTWWNENYGPASPK